jgi:hypothetical protein
MWQELNLRLTQQQWICKMQCKAWLLDTASFFSHLLLCLRGLKKVELSPQTSSNTAIWISPLVGAAETLRAWFDTPLRISVRLSLGRRERSEVANEISYPFHPQWSNESVHPFRNGISRAHWEAESTQSLDPCSIPQQESFLLKKENN